MCQKRSTVIAEVTANTKFRCDECIRHLLISMRHHAIHTVASCCGHGKYPLTIVCEKRRGTNKYYEVVSGIEIPRTRNFYRLDSEGYYYIPETIKGLIQV